MKFLINPTQEALSRARAPVRAFLAFTGVLLVAVIVQRAVTGAFDPAALELTYRPDGAGRLALGAPALWEEIHEAAFIYGFLVLMLGSLLIVCPLSKKTRGTILWVLFGAVLLDLLAPLGVALGLPAAVRLLASVIAAGALLASMGVAWSRFGRERR